MAIFRGTGGAGDATTDAYASEVAQNAATATAKATEAASSASSAANSATSATSSAASASTSATSAATSATTATNEATSSAASAASANSDAAIATTQAGNASTSATNALASEQAASASQTAASTSASQAETSNLSAQASANNANISAGSASASATAASASELNANNSEINALSSENSASDDAASASTSATEAATSATASSTSAGHASTSEANAALSATAASTSASESESARDDAETANTNALASEVAAAASASTASTKANEASTSAISATSSSLAAATSEANAFTSESNAATSAGLSGTSAAEAATSAANAADSATAAASSETNAANSATASATSATNSATSAGEAATSASSAAGSAGSAATSATNASTSAGAASTSASNASTSEGNAASSETSASNSATAASNSETAAALSETNAATSAVSSASSAAASAASASASLVSENNSATSETNAATSETASANSAAASASSAASAASSATSAASSATAAASSASSASTSATDAANILDEFDDIYLGTKATDPTLDNDGDALVQGTLYFNSTNSEMRVYTGSVWVAAYVSLGDALLGASNLSDVASAETSRSNLGLGTADDVEFLSVALSDSESDEGVISWDSVSKTANLTMGNGVTQQIGEELYYPKRTRNMTGTTIPDGTPVMLVGGVGEDSYIAPAIADGSISHEYYAGLTTESIANGDYGRVLFFGTINDVNTSSYTKGQLLYVSDTTHGAFTTTQPEAPSHSILAAIVTKVGTTDGRLFVRVHTNPEAGEITFDNTASGLVSSSVQGAIDELQTNKASVDLLSSNITLFPTTATSPDVSGHNRLVTTKTDSDYDATSQSVATGTITASETLVGQLASDAGLVEGSIAGITITIIGNIEKLTGNNNQGSHFYFKIYRRESDGTEHLMGESFHTSVLYETDGYEQFTSSVYLSDSGLSDFSDTDRFVIRFYGVSTGGNTSYQFQFGGDSPVRSLIPVPVSVIPKSSAQQTPTTTTNFDNILSSTNSNVQSALDALDDHGHAIAGITGLEAALIDKVSVTGYNKSNWDDAYSWGDHADAGYLTTYTDTDTTYATATSSVLGLVKIGYTASGKNYPVELSSNQMYVNVPWSDTDTIYTHPTYAGDDLSVDTGALTGATVISDLDFNVTTDTLGHVTDANATVATRTLTAANIGALPITHDMTLTLNGDVTGTATFTNMGNATLTVAVANDSHTHDSRYYTKTESEARYVNTVGDTLTGRLVFDQQTVTANTASTIIDFSTANDFIVNMSANTTFSFSNLLAGQTGLFYLKQDSLGGRTFLLPSQAKTPQGGATIVQQTGGSSVSVLSYTVLDTNTVLVNYVGDYA